MIQPTPTPTPTGFDNASMDITSGFAAFGDMAPVVGLLLYAAVALLAANSVAPALARSQTLGRIRTRIVAAIEYAIKGVAVSAVLAVTALPIWLVATADASTRGVALEYIGYALAVFGALVVIGWLGDRAVGKFIDAHPHYEEWADIIPESEDAPPDAEEVAD